jgi:hypothetical protein
VDLHRRLSTIGVLARHDPVGERLLLRRMNWL